jgi:hypothetical protein
MTRMRVDRRRVAFVLAVFALGACTGQELNLGDGNGTAPEPAVDAEFGEPRVIAALESEDESDDDPSLTEDRRLLCFNSKRDAGKGREDIWCTSREDSTATWGTPEPQSDLNTESRETGIALSLDGLSLWFSSDRDGGDGGLDVYTATRTARDASWSAAVRVTELSSENDDLVSSIDETGRTLLLARRTRDSDDSDDDSDDDYDVLVARRSTLADPWQPPAPLDEINTDDEESDAFLVGTGLALIFTRDEDLMLSRRASVDAGFDSGKAIESLNSDDDDRDAWSDAAFDYVIFSSDRDGGTYRLYEAERSR